MKKEILPPALEGGMRCCQWRHEQLHPHRFLGAGRHPAAPYIRRTAQDYRDWRPRHAINADQRLASAVHSSVGEHWMSTKERSGHRQPVLHASVTLDVWMRYICDHHRLYDQNRRSRKTRQSTPSPRHHELTEGVCRQLLKAMFRRW